VGSLLTSDETNVSPKSQVSPIFSSVTVQIHILPSYIGNTSYFTLE